jgi:hypothetical protein
MARISAGIVMGLKWEQLLRGIWERAWLGLLDTLGATLAGTLTPISQLEVL